MKLNIKEKRRYECTLPRNSGVIMTININSSQLENDKK